MNCRNFGIDLLVNTWLPNFNANFSFAVHRVGLICSLLGNTRVLEVGRVQTAGSCLSNRRGVGACERRRRRGLLSVQLSAARASDELSASALLTYSSRVSSLAVRASSSGDIISACVQCTSRGPAGCARVFCRHRTRVCARGLFLRRSSPSPSLRTHPERARPARRWAIVERKVLRIVSRSVRAGAEIDQPHHGAVGFFHRR